MQMCNISGWVCPGLFVLIMGFDDFIWNILTLTRRLSYHKKRIDLCQINQVLTELLAVAVAAWHEDDVLWNMFSYIILSSK